MDDIKDAFNMFDQNGDGSISKDELKVVMKSLGQNASDENIREILHEVGCTNNDSIDYPEFLTMMTRKVATQDLNKEIREVRRYPFFCFSYDDVTNFNNLNTRYTRI